MPDSPRLCRTCFRRGLELPWESDERELGPCTFCGSAYTQTWPVASASASLAPLIEAYERADDQPGTGSDLADRLQDDWNLFAGVSPDKLRRLIAAVAPDATELCGAPVRLRSVDGLDGDAIVRRWSRFRTDLRDTNRWFPVDKDAVLGDLDRILPHHATTVPASHILHRARMCRSDDSFTDAEMRMPPSTLARAGRANPSGIPYLYAASTPHTAIKECRPVHNCLVAVAEFVTDRELSVLNLTSTLAPDPFIAALAFPDGPSWEGYVTAITSHRLREAIATDLSRPVRPVEGEPDYASTQFVCEYAKSKGFDGVKYGSAVDPGNWNLVLFSDADITCRGVVLHEVTALDVETSLVPS